MTAASPFSMLLSAPCIRGCWRATSTACALDCHVCKSEEEESVADRRGERHREEEVTKIAAPQHLHGGGARDHLSIEGGLGAIARAVEGESHLKDLSEGVSLQGGEMQCRKARVEAWPAIISIQAFNQQDSSQCMWGKTNQPSSTMRSPP